MRLRRRVLRSDRRIVRSDRRVVCFNRGMVGYQHTASGPSDLEPFWPSRQYHDFDRVCCRAWNAQAL